MLLIVALDGGFIGRAPVDGDLLGHAVAADRLGQKAFRGLLVALLREQKINRLALLIHGAIQISPFAFHLNIRFIHPPADPHRALTPGERRFQQGTIFHDPALDGRVVDRHPTLFHQFFDMAITQGICHVPADTDQNNLLGKCAPLKLIAISLSLMMSRESWRNIIPQMALKENCDTTQKGSFFETAGFLSHLRGDTVGEPYIWFLLVQLKVLRRSDHGDH